MSAANTLAALLQEQGINLVDFNIVVDEQPEDECCECGGAHDCNDCPTFKEKP